MKIKIIVFFLLFLNFQVYSKHENPYIFIEEIIEKTKPCLINSDNKCLEDLIESYLDLQEVSVWIVGKHIWFNAADDIKFEFLKEIKKLILRTYSSTISYYIDSDVVFMKNKNDLKYENKSRIQVSSIMKKNGKNVHIAYRLIKKNDSWLVFDVVMEGVSILKSLQTQYSAAIKENGIDYIIKKMKVSSERY